MSQTAPQPETSESSPPLSEGLDPGSLTLRQAADALGSSTTTLRKMIRQGHLPEAEKVKTLEGRVWAIPADSISGIAERSGFSVSLVDAIDLRDPETAVEEAEQVLVDLGEVDNTIRLDTHRLQSWRDESAPSETVEIDLGAEPVAAPIGRRDTYETEPLTDSSVPVVEATTPEASTAIESIGTEADVESVQASTEAPTLADVLDTALLEKLLGAKDAETVALVKAERQQTEYEGLAARQLEVEQRYFDVAVERSDLADRLQNEALARAISDARVTELRDQLQREITYAEAERYERRQALARETKAAAEAAETRAALGWWGRRKLRRVN